MIITNTKICVIIFFYEYSFILHCSHSSVIELSQLLFPMHNDFFYLNIISTSQCPPLFTISYPLQYPLLFIISSPTYNIYNIFFTLPSLHLNIILYSQYTLFLKYPLIFIISSPFIISSLIQNIISSLYYPIFFKISSHIHNILSL